MASLDHRQPDRSVPDPSHGPAKAAAETAAYVVGEDTGAGRDQFSVTPSDPTTPAFFRDHPRYKLLRHLGRGGMGSVFLAEHRVMERLVAIKVIRPDLALVGDAAERFNREIKLASRLQHPNIVAAYDAEEIEGVHAFVMEYIPGIDLAALVARDGKMPIARACDYARQVALGLEHAHQFGMVHRDIKPHNLMLATSGQVKILDFGLAHFVAEVKSATQSGTVLGSVDYMSPEQAAEPHATDIRADIYSLGCTLYHFLTGRAPFTGSLAERLRAHAESPPERPEDVSQELWEVIGRMLAKAPQDRFQTPAEVANALEPFATSASQQFGRARPVGAWLDHRRRQWPLAMLSIAIVGAVVAIVSTFLNPGAPEPPPQAYRRAMALLDQRQERQAKDAIHLLTQAIDERPDSAELHSALASAYNLCGDYSWLWPDDAFTKARKAAETALELDDELAEAHLALAFVLHAYDCDWDAAEEEYLEALRLNPDSTDAHHWYAWFLVQQRRVSEAEHEMELAADLGPDRSIILTNAGQIRYYARQYTEAEQYLQKALSINPDYRKARWDLVFVYAEMNRLDDALAEFKSGNFKALSEDGRDLDAALAYVYARNGRGDDARPLLEKLIPKADKHSLAYEISLIYSALGEKDEAFDWLDRAFRERSAWRTFLKVDPRLDGIRADKRFQKYLKLAGF